MATYQESGVDIAAATRAKQMMADAVRSTHSRAVLASMGAFGGCFDLSASGAPDRPVLVASTDSVGTKTLVAAAVGRYDTVGQDLVNHCINDILVQGARPLFFLDYIAVAQLIPQQVADIVAGVAEACRAAGCALIGGETAELPDVYREGAFDLAGTIVGVVEREWMLPRVVAAGDAILALPSTGLHTNGYSLARRIVAQMAAATEGPPYSVRVDMLGQTVGGALLAVHRCYLREVESLWAASVPIHALAHITGGGLYDNLPRVLPSGLGAKVQRGSWEIPPIFEWLVRAGNLDQREAFHVFNMGLGMLVIVPPGAVDLALRTLPEARLVGEVTAGEDVSLYG
jgi:phosphoribosylformylglycinamidine cyclo-ligase